MKLPRLRSRVGLCTLCWLVFVSRLAQAQWQPGYESNGFAGGGALCAVEFDGMVAIGGAFESAACANSPGVVLSDFEQFYALGDGLWRSFTNPDGVNHVAALTVWNGDLIAGGRFRGSDYSDPQNVGRWDGSQWVRVGELAGTSSGGTSVVLDLAVYEGELIAVGNFTSPGLSGVARFDGVSWQPMGTRPQGAEALAVWQGELYCGLSQWDGTQWVALGSLGRSSDRVTALDVVDEGLAIGGKFSSIDGEQILGAAIWNGVTLQQFGNGVSTRYDPGYDEGPYPAGVAGFASIAGNTYVLAPMYGGYEWFGLGRLTQLPPLGKLYWRPEEGIGWPDNFGTETGDLAVVGQRLVAVMGTTSGLTDLADAGGLEAIFQEGGAWKPLSGGLGRSAVPRTIASLNGANWLLQDGVGLLQEREGQYRRLSYWPQPLSLGNKGDGVYVAGAAVDLGHVIDVRPFLREYELNGQSQHECWYFENWSDWPGNEFGDANMLRTVIPWESGYLGEAQFVEPFSHPVDPLQAQTRGLLHITDGCLATLALRLDTTIDAMVIHQGQAWYASNGELVQLSGMPGEPLDALVVATFNQRVHALVSDGDRLLVGGEFHSVNGIVSPHLAILQSGSWQDAPAVDGPIHALARSQDGVVVLGGEFQSIDGRATQNLAVIHGSGVGAFADGPNGAVSSLAIAQDGMLVAGEFTQVGGQCSVHVAEWVGDLRTVSIARDDTPPGSEEVLATRLRLHEPMPNPFNPRVVLAFDLPRAAVVDLRIFDLAGRKVRSLASGRFAKGTHELQWAGDDDFGQPVAAGVYLASVVSEGQVDQRKLTLVK